MKNIKHTQRRDCTRSRPANHSLLAKFLHFKQWGKRSMTCRRQCLWSVWTGWLFHQAVQQPPRDHMAAKYLPSASLQKVFQIPVWTVSAHPWAPWQFLTSFVWIMLKLNPDILGIVLSSCCVENSPRPWTNAPSTRTPNAWANTTRPKEEKGTPGRGRPQCPLRMHERQQAARDHHPMGPDRWTWDTREPAKLVSINFKRLK